MNVWTLVGSSNNLENDWGWKSLTTNGETKNIVNYGRVILTNGQEWQAVRLVIGVALVCIIG